MKAALINFLIAMCIAIPFGVVTVEYDRISKWFNNEKSKKNESN